MLVGFATRDDPCVGARRSSPSVLCQALPSSQELDRESGWDCHLPIIHPP